MNPYVALREVLKAAQWPEAYDIRVGVLLDLAYAYEMLAPSPELWAKYPWAKWCAIDANGSIGLFGQEPEIEHHVWVIEWGEESELPVEVGTVVLPPHIDWRDCKWPRPASTPIDS